MTKYQFYRFTHNLDGGKTEEGEQILIPVHQETEPKPANRFFDFAVYVPEAEAQEMFAILQRLVQWDETDQHSDDDMIAVGKFESIVNDARKIIQRT